MEKETYKEKVLKQLKRMGVNTETLIESDLKLIDVGFIVRSNPYTVAEMICNGLFN